MEFYNNPLELGKVVPCPALFVFNIFFGGIKMKTICITTDLTTVIAPENVQLLGEHIAVSALKHLAKLRHAEKLYYDLIRDIHSRNDPSHTFSDGYDFVQTAICFLCEHIGKKLGDITVDKNGNSITLRHACYSELGRLFYQRTKYAHNTFSIIEKDATKSPQPFEDSTQEKERSLNRVEKIIQNMALSDKHAKTLEYYMQGKGVVEIARLLCVANCTIWRYRMYLRRRYNEVINLM